MQNDIYKDTILTNMLFLEFWKLIPIDIIIEFIILIFYFFLLSLFNTNRLISKHISNYKQQRFNCFFINLFSNNLFVIK